jgi:outer membrane receptor protein involved in Fe transport
LNLSTFLGRHVLITDQDRYAAGTRPRSIERADMRANDYHVRGVGELHVDRVKIETGAEVSGRFGLRAIDSIVSFDLNGNETGTTDNLSVDSAHRTDAGAYVNLETALKPTLVVAGGARVDRVTTQNEGGYFGDRSTANSALSGVASLTAGPYGGWSVTGQVARGFRDPFLSDRYFRGPSGRGFITGFPDLEPEHSLQYDGAARYTGRNYRLAFYAYQYRIVDLIERYEATPDNFFFRNRGRARIRGLEAEAQIEIGDGWHLELTGQLARGITLEDDAPLDDIAPASVSGVVRKALPRGAYAQVRLATFAKDDNPGPTERDMPGYVLFDAVGAIPLADGIELQINGRNLLDKDYLASPDPRTVPAPGASVLATLMMKF